VPHQVHKQRAASIEARQSDQGMADARATISGRVEALSGDEEASAARKVFTAKYPNSFWVDFGAPR
jgi:hypothetical protein